MIDKGFLSAFAPRFILGALAVGAAGALTGAAIGDLNPVDRGIGDDGQAFGRFASEAWAGSPAEQSSLPDHYPLVTPEGTVPVEELALHGRLRDQRGWWEHDDGYMFEADYPDQLSDAEIERLAEWNPPPQRTSSVSDGSVEVHRTDNSRVEYVSLQSRARPVTVEAQQGKPTQIKARIESDNIEPSARGGRPPVIQIASEPGPIALN